MAPADADWPIEVAYSPAPREVRLLGLRLAPGAVVRDALLACGWFDAANMASDQAMGELAVGIWGRKATLDTPLKPLDRVEVYRPLTVDPKEARRQRYRAHGEKLPKGYHRPRDWVKDMTQSPGKGGTDAT